jgi:hypothetical protein
MTGGGEGASVKSEFIVQKYTKRLRPCLIKSNNHEFEIFDEVKSVLDTFGADLSQSCD